MLERLLELIARLLGRRDDNTIPPEPVLELGAPDIIEDDKSTPLVPESEKGTKPPVDEPRFPPPPLRPPTIIPPGISPPSVEIPEDTPDPTTKPMGITTVGAWCGSRSLARPEKYVQFAADHGINRLDIVVNDHSKWREPKDFTLRNSDKIVRLAKLAHEAGIEVHLMSWIMPHPGYIAQAAEQLIPLATLTNAASIQWDAEEPWMLARNHGGHRRGAEAIANAFRHLPIPMGVNGIGYASVKKLKPLADVCDYLVPQVYSTRTNGLDPRTAPAKFHRRWDKYFKKQIVMGLAAYRQSGIHGYKNATEAMQAAADAAAAIDGVDTVIYWSLYHATKNKAVAKVIASIRERRTSPIT